MSMRSPATTDRFCRNFVLRCCGVGLAACCLALAADALLAQPPAGPQQPARIFEAEPFDRLTLDAANENAELKVRPIPFPNRRVPVKPKPSEKLRVKLLDDARDFDIAWQNIKKVELFENMVLEEAVKLTQANRIDEAYPYFVFLLDNYPKTEGLPEGRQLFLYQAAIFAFGQKNFAEALGILEELRSLNPDFRKNATAPTVIQSLGSVADNLIGSYVAKNDYRSARVLLERLVRTYQAGNEPFATKWVTQLSELAAAERDKARALLAEEKFVEAYDASARMKNIWAAVPGGEELLTEMSRRYPLVVVGVSTPAKAFDGRSLVDPAARRAGRMVQRQLMEFTGMGPEGGKYISPFGSFSRSDDGTNFTLEFKAQGNKAAPLTAFDVSQRLLQLANEKDPDYQAAWARLVSTVQVKQATQVQVELRLPHVLPEALLQVDALPTNSTSAAKVADQANAGFGPFRILSTTPDTTRFVRNDDSPFVTAGQPAEVVERYFEDPQRAILALKRGEVDVLDQVFVADLGALMQEPGIVVKQYSAPTSHFLLINRAHPYLDSRTFRRALLYGCDRAAIFKQGFLRDQVLPGWRVTSAPFPAPSRTGETIAYGYDEQIAPRPYDPRLAIVLKVLTQNQLKIEAEKKKAEVPKWRPLLLGHPADEVSRLACKALVKQWEIVGIECKLQEFPLGTYRDPSGKCDLTYVQGAAWEPLVDAGRLFGAEGLSPSNDPFIRLALKQIESASNWQQVRQRMQQLHLQVHEDVSVLPLWQTYDYYAFRQGFTALESSRATLYQNVQQWQPAARLARN
jgi:ABC-type transport system substrate-binding protein